MTKITAIVSAYYSEKYLKGRLVNLFDQNLGDNLQVIVICKKDTLDEKIAFEFLKNTSCPLIISTLDVPTVYDAWNQCIREAKGEYITNANSDDRLYPGALGAMAHILDREKKHAVAYTNIHRVTEIDGEPKGVFEWAEGGLDVLYFRGCFLGPMPMWRKSLHETYGWFNPEMRSAGDYDFWMRLAAGGEKFFHIREILGAHLEREDALEHREPVRTLWEVSRIKGQYRSKMELLRDKFEKKQEKKQKEKP